MSGRILIVDEETEFTRALRATFEVRSYEVVTAYNRRQAEISARGQKPDAVIIGTIIPQGDAFLFHQWLKQTPRFSDIPMVVIDARPEEQLLKGWRPFEGICCEAEEYLMKPVEPSALLPRIEKLLDKVTRRIRVLIADDHGMVRDGIRAVLSLQHDMQVIGDAVNGREALEKTIGLTPDIVLMDIRMPIMDGLEATREICRRCKEAKVLMLTQYDDEENVRASREVGAMGFIPKAAVSSLLLNGIRSVNEGKQFAHNATG